jgi:hypothetical protein
LHFTRHFPSAAYFKDIDGALIIGSFVQEGPVFMQIMLVFMQIMLVPASP